MTFQDKIDKVSRLLASSDYGTFMLGLAMIDNDFDLAKYFYLDGNLINENILMPYVLQHKTGEIEMVVEFDEDDCIPDFAYPEYHFKEHRDKWKCDHRYLWK